MAVTFPVSLCFSTLQGRWQSSWLAPPSKPTCGVVLGILSLCPSIHPFKQQSWRTPSAPMSQVLWEP